MLSDKINEFTAFTADNGDDHLLNKHQLIRHLIFCLVGHKDIISSLDEGKRKTCYFGGIEINCRGKWKRCEKVATFWIKATYE